MILFLAAINDYRYQQVPNSLSMTGWLIGPLMAYLTAGGEGVAQSLYGLLLMLVLFLPLWLIKWFGAADVKLMATVGAFVGLGNSLIVILAVTLSGFVMAVLMLMLHGQLWHYLRQWLVFPLTRTLPSVSFSSDEKGGEKMAKLSYAIPIAFGTIVSILYLQI